MWSRLHFLIWGVTGGAIVEGRELWRALRPHQSSQERRSGRPGNAVAPTTAILPSPSRLPIPPPFPLGNSVATDDAPYR